jgi:hypothetical protein
MDIPGLGTFTRDSRFNWYYSVPVPVPVLGGQACRIVVEGYEEDQGKADFHTAINNFLSIGPAVLEAAAPFVFQYYQDIRGMCDDEDIVAISSPREVWRHVQLGTEPMVKRRPRGDNGVYVSVECDCDWEAEHGLKIVFKNGLTVNKVGPFNGHLTTSDAKARPELENVVYCRVGE